MGVSKCWHERGGDGGEMMMPGCRWGMCSAEAAWEGLVSPQKGENLGDSLSSSSRFLSTDADLVGIRQGRAGSRSTFLIRHSLSVSKQRRRRRGQPLSTLQTTPPSCSPWMRQKRRGSAAAAAAWSPWASARRWPCSATSWRPMPSSQVLHGSHLPPRAPDSFLQTLLP